MKKPVSKAQIRAEIEQQISDFLNKGGSVESVQPGISGHDNSEGPIKLTRYTFQSPRSERTYLPHVVAALDARRRQKPEKPKPARRQPRKKIIYDDFGEPVRWEWEE